jgi:uncharacterized membrane protein YraQ (UPF0718 family)
MNPPGLSGGIFISIIFFLKKSLNLLWNNFCGASKQGKPNWHTLKSTFMLSRPVLNRVLILLFMALLGYSLARAIYWKSVMGIILALISIIATICFLFILAKAKKEMSREETT